ncbi:MAG: fasciclin domain-containing protein [Saprospiraceae bacterium]|nr:fasciclin domain-containing protein [Saprospiraceae bacterium]
MKKKLLSLSVFALSVLLWSCGGSEKSTQEADTTQVDTTAQVEETPQVMEAKPKNIAEIAMADEANFSTLVTALSAAGLVEAVSGEEPLTVFAPTNAAFDAVGKDAVADLLKPENKEKLSKILTYHVVKGSVKSTDLKDGQEVETLQGGKLKVSIKDGKVMIGGANVVTADVEASNGTIHVIDKVLMP